MEKRIAHLASFPELNPNPVMEIDWAGQVLYLNPASQRLFPDFQNSGSRHPFLADLESVVSIFREGRTTSHARHIQVGSSWYHQAFYAPPESKRFRIYAFDITKQMEAQAKIEDSERKYRALYEGSQDGYVFTDLKGTILECNIAFKEMVGYTEGELKGLTYLDLTPPKWHELEAEIVQNQVLARGYSHLYEKEYRRKDGTVFPISLRTYLAKDVQGKPLGMWAFARDITERKRAEEELRKTNERLNLLSKTASQRADELDRMVRERTRDLSERIKELDCLCTVSGLLNEEEASLEDILQRTVEVIPSGWQFPEIACVRAVLDKREYRTGNFRETPWLQTSAIISEGRQAGILEVGYLEERPGRDEGPFLDEERTLLDALADQMGEFLERNKTHQDLRKTNELLEGVFSSIDLLIAYMDRDFNFIRVNRAYAEADGRTPEFYIGKNHFTLFPNEENEAIFRRVVESGEPYSVVDKAFTYADNPDRGVTYWDWSLHPVKEIDGRVSGVVLSLVNVTDRKRAQDALQASSIYTRRLIEASLDPLVTISPEGKITDVNRGTELATGVPREDLIGSDFSNYFTEPTKAREGYERVFKEGAVRDYSLAIRHVSGKVTDVLYNATVYRNEVGEVQGVFAAARDITQRKQAEEAMRQNEQLLRNVLELLPVGVWIADKEGVITYGNPAGRRIWAGHRYVGIERFGEYKGWWLHTGKQIEPEEWAVARAIRKGETSLNEEIEIECFDGSHKIILNSALPLRNDKNEITGAFIINDDITERRQAEQRIRQMQKMEALGTLAGGIAHDFNNILMPIIINSELALLDVKQGVLPSSNYMQLVKEAATRGQELVKQIITFSRQREQPRQPVDVNPVIKEALKFLRASIPKNIEIRSSIEVEPAVVLADPTQIHQVLMNLCSNAAYAMRSRGGTLQVSLSRVEGSPESKADRVELKAGPYLRLTVSDTGHGMDPEVRERAFDPFFTTKKPGEGTGMGLAVVHGIVKNHEGAITLESEVGKGTRAHVFLPLAQADQARQEDPPGPIPTGKERVLLIDDEEIQVRTLQHTLERLGYRVIAKTRAPEALETFRTQPDAFDLVITDQTMPELTGANLAREVLRIRPDLPIILYTGYSEILDEEEARSIGIRDFALKPLTVRDLAERIRRALKK
jgi:PAS domain S-box-containing protein